MTLNILAKVCSTKYNSSSWEKDVWRTSSIQLEQRGNKDDLTVNVIQHFLAVKVWNGGSIEKSSSEHQP